MCSLIAVYTKILIVFYINKRNLQSNKPKIPYSNDVINVSVIVGSQMALSTKILKTLSSNEKNQYSNKEIFFAIIGPSGSNDQCDYKFILKKTLKIHVRSSFSNRQKK